MKRPASGSSETSAHDASSNNPLVRKLSHFAPLSASDCEVLDDLAFDGRRIATDVDIIAEGEPARLVFLILEGMAIRYRDLPDGGRQIMTFLLTKKCVDVAEVAWNKRKTICSLEASRRKLLSISRIGKTGSDSSLAIIRANGA